MSALAKLEEILNAHTLSADHEAFLRDKLAKQEPQMPKILQANKIFREFEKSIIAQRELETSLDQTRQELNETQRKLDESIRINQSSTNTTL